MINELEVRGDRLKVRGEEKQYSRHMPNRLITLSPDCLNTATGLLFESDNADELAEKMLWALEHPEEVKQMIGQAQAEVQKYSWNSVRKQLLGVYNYE